MVIDALGKPVPKKQVLLGSATCSVSKRHKIVPVRLEVKTGDMNDIQVHVMCTTCGTWNVVKDWSLIRCLL